MWLRQLIVQVKKFLVKEKIISSVDFTKLAQVYVIALNYIVVEILLTAQPIGKNTNEKPIHSLLY